MGWENIATVLFHFPVTTVLPVWGSKKQNQRGDQVENFLALTASSSKTPAIPQHGMQAGQMVQ
jgi:hypothetical protein